VPNTGNLKKENREDTEKLFLLNAGRKFAEFTYLQALFPSIPLLIKSLIELLGKNLIKLNEVIVLQFMEVPSFTQ